MLLTILTYSRANINLLSTFWEWLPALLWANAVTGIAAILAQIDIPQETWAQYPLILIGVVLVGWLSRYWVANEREWRTFTTQQVTDRESANLRTLQLIQVNNEQQLNIIIENHKEQIALIERNHQEQLKLQRDGLRDVFDSELERVLDLLAKAGHYEKTKELGRQGHD